MWQRAPHVSSGLHSLSSTLLPCGKQVRRLRRGGRDRAAHGRKEAPPTAPSRSPWPKLLQWCTGAASPTGLRGEREREGGWGGVAAAAERPPSRGREFGEGDGWTEEPEACDIRWEGGGY
jgi:hypothetical protein